MAQQRTKMKTKYQFTVSITGVTPGKIEKFTGMDSSYETLIGNLGDINYSSPLRQKGSEKLKAHLESFIQERRYRSFQKDKDVFKVSNKEMTISIKEVHFDDSYYESGIIEAFHTSLRKNCDSKASWGLWQWITFCADNQANPILEVFWSNLAYLWRKVDKKYPDLHNESSEKLTKVAKEVKRLHMEEMDNDPRMRVLLKDEKLRPLWYMMKGLYFNLPDGEMGSLLYTISECKVK